MMVCGHTLNDKITSAPFKQNNCSTWNKDNTGDNIGLDIVVGSLEIFLSKDCLPFGLKLSSQFNCTNEFL